MTRTAFALYATGALAAGSAIVAAQGALWWPAAVLVFIATFLYAAADRDREYARAAKEQQEARERAVRATILNGPALTAGFAALGDAARTAGAGLAQARDALANDQEQRP